MPKLKLTQLKNGIWYVVLSEDIIDPGQFIEERFGVLKSKEQYMKANEASSSNYCMYLDNGEQFIVVAK